MNREDILEIFNAPPVEEKVLPFDERAVEFIHRYYTEEDAVKVLAIPMVKGILRSKQNSHGKCGMIVKIAKLNDLRVKNAEEKTEDSTEA